MIKTALKDLPVTSKVICGLVHEAFSKQNNGNFFSIFIKQYEQEDPTYQIKFHKFWDDQKDSDSFIVTHHGSFLVEDKINGFLVSGHVDKDDLTTQVEIRQVTILTNHTKGETKSHRYLNE